EEASPERLLAVARAHWAIENKLHHVRDVSLNEDRCRVRAGARPLATLRNLVLTLIRRAGMHVPEARENFREDRAAAIAAVTGKIL
ncbi:MAG: ISAs1 family transposase, partial [Hyphomicrobiales bacterium]